MQFWNARLPILVTLAGKLISVNPLHPENAKSPILVKLDGKVISVKLLQSENASLPILSSCESPSIVTVARLVQFWNA